MKTPLSIITTIFFFQTSTFAIVNGEQVSPGSKIAFSTVGLHFTKGVNSRDGYCSAVVLDQDVLLTDAHCAESADLSVLIGSLLQRKGSYVPSAEKIEIEKIYKKPAYDKLKDPQDKFRQDIAIIKLKKPLPPGYVPADLSFNSKQPLSSYVAVGFGVQSASGAGTHLSESSGAATENVELRSKTLQSAAFDNEVIQIKQPKGGLCEGDSGGPLVDPSTVSDRHIKVEAINLTAGGGDGPQCSTVAFALRLAPHKNWILGTEDEIDKTRPGGKIIHDQAVEITAGSDQ
jgi:secreted trypsin-like serine protease